MASRTVEYEPGWGWIARNPWTGKEVIENFRWSSRSVARAVADEARLLSKPEQQEV
jgi:hypothetical protein